MITVNERCSKLTHKLRLPTMESLADFLRAAAKSGRSTYLCKLNVSNMFWSCMLPEPEARNIHFGVRDRVLQFHSLPFGWNYNPIMATELLRLSIENQDQWIRG